MTQSQRIIKTIIVIVILMAGTVTPLEAQSLFDDDKPALGEWTENCQQGFKIAAMPGAWAFNPEQGPLDLITHIAIDFELLSKESYEIISTGRGPDERFFNLSGYTYMAMEAQIRKVGTGEISFRIPGVYETSKGKEAIIFSWTGLNEKGTPVNPGIYEITVRGRFVPTWTGLRAEDGFGYSDLEGWSSVDEACTRTLRIEVIDEKLPNPITRGVSCAPPDASYYTSVDATNQTTLRATLHPVIDDHTRYPYSATSTDTWDLLNDADENPSNTTQLLTVYKNEANADGCSSGCVWNREHTWPSSFGFSVESGNGRIPYTDCHHLHAADPGYNSTRSNKPHNNCPGCTEYATDANNGFGGTASDVNKGSGGATSCGNTPTTNEVWETLDHRKGDIARSILYMDIRYEGDSGALGAEQDLIATSDLGLMMVETTTCGDGYQDPAYHGVLSTLLAWHAADPVDTDEERRNGQVWCYQGNRNPFVDHPEWVDCLYNNICTAGPVFGGIDAASDLGPCADTGVQIDWTLPSDWNDGCSSGCSRGFNVSRDGVDISSGGCAGPLSDATITCTDTTGTNNTMYTYRVEAFNNDANTSDGGTSDIKGDYVDDATGPVIASGPSASPFTSSFTATWTTDEPSDSYLEWGLSSGSYTNNTSNASDVTSHSLTATGLSTTTLYYYRVCSTDPCGNGPSCSGEATVTTALNCDPGSNTGVFINELHYDNAGTDTGEFVEVAGPAGTDLGSGPWSIELYNGSGGVVYDSFNLSGTLDDEGAGYGALAFFRTGIQNGDPDGLALLNGAGAVVQFLCYDGVLSAAAGTAAFGITCDQIAVSEPGAIGESLQLTGGPAFVYENFTWSGPSAESPGSINNGQTMSCGPSPPSFGGIDLASDLDPCDTTGVRIDWTTPSNWNDGCSSSCSRGFHIYRDSTLITTGGCSDPQAEAAVSCVDTTGAVDTLYTYTVEAFNNDGNSDDGGTAAGARDVTNDGTAPVITVAPSATPSSTSFTVSWTTDEVSDSFLEWGTSSGVYTSDITDAADVVTHSVTATGLTANITYYYRVCSTDPCDQGPTCSAEDTVVTTGSCDPDAGEHPVFINELHYDDASTDADEFIEIAGPAGTDLGAESYSVELYNGSSSQLKLYDTVTLTGTIDDEGAGYGGLAFYRAGIQNGAPDGLALVKGSTVVQFLCYEGTFTPIDGAAAGTTCTDIGVSESGSEPEGLSLQLKGGPGFVYEDFTWNSASTWSPGSINAGQDMSCEPPPDQLQFFTATSTDGQVKLEWENPASYPAGGTTRICRDPSSYPTDPATCTIAGTLTEQAGGNGTYDSVTDVTALTNGATYFYSAWVVNSGGAVSARKTVTARPFDTSGATKWVYHSSTSSLVPPGLYPGAAGTGAAYTVANDNAVHAMHPGPTGGDWPRTAPFAWTPMLMNGPAGERPPVVPIALGSATLVVFVASEDGHAYAVDGHIGTVIWQSPALGSMLTGSVSGEFSAFSASAYDLLFIGTRDAGSANHMHGLNLANGSIAWTFSNGGTAIGIISSGATVDYATHRLYFTSREHATGSTSTVWCISFDGVSASLVWERALGDIDSAPTLYDGRVYVGNNNGDVYSLDAATGATIWPYSTASGAVKGFISQDFTAIPRKLYFTTTNDVWALTDNGATVSLAWKQPGIAGPSIPLVTDFGHVLVGSTDGSVYQLNTSDGGVHASLLIGSGAATVGSPSFDYVHSIAYVGSENGFIYSVSLPLP